MGVDGADTGRSKWSQVFILLNIFVLFCFQTVWMNCILKRKIFFKKHPTFFVVFIGRYLFAILLKEEVAKGTV